jgi:methyltransferase-like protein/SAM-dependent methyltransferase
MTGTNPRPTTAAVPAGAPAPSALGVNAYDAVPYRSRPFRLTHPDHLATVATLFGMAPAPTTRCRVLELGCAGGGNLIPMALALPGSDFVGVDLSARQITDGQRLVAALGLANVALEHLDLLDVGADFGAFDYIVCHGVYSWVPAPVRDRILEICERHLAPQGVAFISYNTYPGWHLSGMIRDMIVFHARRFTDPEDRARQARALLKFLAETAAPNQSAYSKLLQEGLDLFGRVSDDYLEHEYLEAVNEPVYFHQFVERAESHGLQYLAESEFHAMAAWRLPPKVVEAVTGLSSNHIEMEQFLDFVRNRKFRQSLLCHSAVALNRTIGPEKVATLSVASVLAPDALRPDPGPDREVTFRGPLGPGATTSDPLLKACLIHLHARWPQAVPFAELVAACQARFGGALSVGAAETLGKSLLQLYSANLVELRTRPLPLVRDVPVFPVASRLARHQAAEGPFVTNLRHETVSLGPRHRQVLQLLDGSADRAALLTRLGERGPARAEVERCLDDLARAALLCAG